MKNSPPESRKLHDVVGRVIGDGDCHHPMGQREVHWSGFRYDITVYCGMKATASRRCDWHDTQRQCPGVDYVCTGRRDKREKLCRSCCEVVKLRSTYETHDQLVMLRRVYDDLLNVASTRRRGFVPLTPDRVDDAVTAVAALLNELYIRIIIHAATNDQE